MTTAAAVKPAEAPRADVPNDLSAFWLPFTPNRAFKKKPRLISRAKDMHYFTPEGRTILDGTAGLWCCNAGHNRAPIVAAIQRRGGGARLLSDLLVRPSARVPAGVATGRACAGRSRSRLLLQLGLGGLRYGAKDRARLSQCARTRLAPAADRPRAGVSRRRLRRHFGRRHGQQPQVLRLAARRCRPFARDL